MHVRRVGATASQLFVRLISHQAAVLFSQDKSATSNQLTLLFSHNKSASATSHQSGVTVATGAFASLYTNMNPDSGPIAAADVENGKVGRTGQL
jgi:hypothetical protein